MALVEVRCEECEHLNVVRMVPATLTDPGCPDSDTCESCGAGLDLADADPYDAEYDDPSL